jgi:hypothetical protein
MAQTFSECVVDHVVECYVCWREACAAVDEAYDAWRSAPPPERRLARAAYGAALDREQHAALVYSQAIVQVDRRTVRAAA